MKKLGTIVGPVVVIGAMSAPSHADNVLVFGDHAGRDRIGSVLAQDGHTVTIVDAFTANLEPYDVVWHVGAVRPLTDNDQAALTGFVNKGGGLFLTGDAYTADALDRSVEAIVNQTVWKGGIRLNASPIATASEFSVDARAGLAKEPNALYVWEPSVSGSIEGVFGENVLTRVAGEVVTSAAWAGPDMANGRGKLVVMMDAGWSTSPYSIKRIVQNVEKFLVNGVPAFCGNAIAEEGETCDDGNISDSDDCLTSCDVSTCGDGFLHAGAESCDDNNLVGGDGCDAGCQVELSADGDIEDPGDDPIEPGDVIVPDSPEDEEYAAGCSAGGTTGSGGFAVLALALVGLARKRRRA